MRRDGNGARPGGGKPHDRPLSPEEVAARLAGLPGWHLAPGSSGIFRDYGFAEWAGAVLFVAHFGAVVRLSPHDLDFLFDVLGTHVAVALGAGSFEGITPGTFLLAVIADELARLNLAEESEE